MDMKVSGLEQPSQSPDIFREQPKRSVRAWKHDQFCKEEMAKTTSKREIVPSQTI